MGATGCVCNRASFCSTRLARFTAPMFVLSRPAGRVPNRRAQAEDLPAANNPPLPNAYTKIYFHNVKRFSKRKPFFSIIKVVSEAHSRWNRVSRDWGGVSLFGCAKINLFLCFGHVLRMQAQTQYTQTRSPAKPLKKRLPRRKPLSESGGQNWNRTSDTRIFSPPLYQLSYLAVNYYSGIQVDCRNRVNSFFL